MRIISVQHQFHHNLEIQEEDQIVSLVKKHQELNSDKIYQIYLQMVLTKLPFEKINNKVYVAVCLLILLLLYLI